VCGVQSVIEEEEKVVMEKDIDQSG
jgi:hypothetical protein